MSRYYRISVRKKLDGLTKDERYYQKLKQDAIHTYSGGSDRCCCCGETHAEFLGIVAVNSATMLRGKNLYVYLAKSNYPNGFVVKCRNCSILTECPHETEKRVKFDRLKKEI